ncbi:MAG: hypothetical protein U5N86_00630 [Planctomycetota bacterium]|nr:hypothetical protein [Planctomycetota bacterium]
MLEGLREINSSFARHFLRKTAAKVILKQLRESVSVLPSERAYSLLDAFGYSLLKARNYPFAVQTFEYVLKTFKAPESEAELWTRGHLIYCLNRQKKFSEALAEVEKLLGRDELPADLRKRMKSEHHYATQNLERLKRKNKR